MGHICTKVMLQKVQLLLMGSFLAYQKQHFPHFFMILPVFLGGRPIFPTFRTSISTMRADIENRLVQVYSLAFKYHVYAQ